MFLSPHFTLHEFITSQNAARFGIDNTPTPEIIENLRRLAGVLEDVRTIAGVPISISSGYRCPALNKVSKGSKTSAHVAGLAADIDAFGIHPRALATRIASSRIIFDQLILEYPEDGWVHVGLSPILVKARHEILTAKIGKDGKTVYLPGIV